MKKYKWLCLALIMSFNITNAQESLTLEQCKKLALGNNVRIKNSKENILSAEQAKKEAFTKYFPSVSANGFWYNANKGLVEMELAPTMGVSMLKNGVGVGIGAMQPIFAGGQIVNGNKLAQIGIDISEIQIRQSENEVNITTEQYFLQIILLKEKLKTIESIEEMLDRLCKDVEVAVKAGVNTRNDLLQVELRQNEIQSNKIKINNSIALYKMLLAQYIGIDSTSFNLRYTFDKSSMPKFAQEIFVNHQEALYSTQDYKLLIKNVDANKINVKMEVGKTLPSMGIGAGYMYDNLMDKDHYFGVVGASVSIPISGWWGGSHAIKNKKIQLQKAENDLTDKSQLIVIGMQKAWNNVTDTYKQLEIAYKSIAQSAENLRMNQNFYQAGTATMTDLLNAQTLFQQSNDRYVEAYTAYQLKQLEYLQATGR